MTTLDKFYAKYAKDPDKNLFFYDVLFSSELYVGVETSTSIDGKDVGQNVFGFDFVEVDILKEDIQQVKKVTNI